MGETEGEVRQGNSEEIRQVSPHPGAVICFPLHNQWLMDNP